MHINNHISVVEHTVTANNLYVHKWEGEEEAT